MKSFLRSCSDYIAGDPTDETIRRTNLACWQIVDKLREKGADVSKNTVRQLLKKHGFKKGKYKKQ